MIELPQHHIGFAVKDIHKTQKIWVESGALPLIDIESDPEQGVYCSLLRVSSSSKIELISPLPGTKHPLETILQNKGGLHHICYESDDIELDLIRLAKSKSFIVISEPKYARIFDAQIAFLMLKGGFLVELLQYKRTRPSSL